MSDLLQMVGAGLFGIVSATIGSVVGFKVKINGLEKRVNHIRDHVVYEDRFEEAIKGLESKLDLAISLFREERK